MSSPASSPAAPGSARDLRRRQFGLAVALLALPAAFVLFQMFFGQSVAFLYGDRDRAEWITYPHAPSAKVVVVDPTRPVPLRFEKSFTLARMPERAVMLHVRVLDRVELVVNSIRISDEQLAGAGPRVAGSTDIARHLRVGENVIRARVRNAVGPRLLLLWMEGLGQPLASDASWTVALPGGAPVPVMLADDTLPNPEAKSAATPWEVFLRKWGALAVLFVASCGLFLLARGLDPVWRRRAPVAVALGLSIAWIWLFVAKTVPTPIEFGFDSRGHLEYIDSIRANGELPRPGRGWSTSHPPLFYALAAGLEVAGDALSGASSRDVTLRLLPLLSGLGIVWLTIPFSRRVFGDDPLRVTLATLVAGTLPLNLGTSTYVSNESLHAFFATIALWLAFVALEDRPTRPRSLACLGLVFGLALLSKFTSVLPLGLAGAFLAWKLLAVEGRRLRVTLKLLGLFALGPIAIAGWYYAANIAEFGTALVPNWGALEERAWWQHPGFHTPAYFLSFGESFRHPDFSAYRSFWDGLYTTLWGDGLNSGVTSLAFREQQHWNFDFMALSYPIAFPATLMMFFGFFRLAVCALRERSAPRQLGSYKSVERRRVVVRPSCRRCNPRTSRTVRPR